MRKFFLFTFFIGIGIVGCSKTKFIDLPQCPPPEGAETGKPGEDTEPVPPTSLSFINSSYIRGDLFEQNVISKESLEACNDLIFLNCHVCSDGEILFSIPENNATLEGNVKYFESFEGRKGVVYIDGSNSSRLNAGIGLLESSKNTIKKNDDVTSFTFSTYLYIDKWKKGAYIFRKGDDDNNKQQCSLQLNDDGEVQFVVNGSHNIVPNLNLEIKKWHYLALSFDKGSVKLYIDDKEHEFKAKYNFVPFNSEVPHTNFIIGEGFDGYFDETAVNKLPIKGAINPIDFTSTDYYTSKYVAYWKYDISDNPGKDTRTWISVLEKIRNVIGVDSNRKLRLGIAGSGEDKGEKGKGGWMYMIEDKKARSKFISKVKEMISKHGFDGIDLDFEWYYNNNQQGLSQYSETIVQLREAIGNDVRYTVSLLPGAYKISKEAINALDFISLQCYGVQHDKWLYESYTKAGEEIISYGIPKEKLVMGIPFYGISKDGSKKDIVYRNLVNEGYIKSPSQNEVTYKGVEYIIDGQDRTKQKVRYVIDNKILGIMSWDLSTDVPITNEKSLLKVVDEEFKYPHF